jgi:hypothetical protein
MPENEFEKEVQQKMDGLKLTPNDEVWQQVASTISKRKTRRGIFWFLSLLLFCSTVGFFIIYNTTEQYSKSTIATQENIPVKNVNQPFVKKEPKPALPVATVTGKGNALKEKIAAETFITQKKTGYRITSKIQPALILLQTQDKAGSVENKEKAVNKNQPESDAYVHHEGSNKIQYKKKQKLSTKVSGGGVENYEKTAAAANKESQKEDDISPVTAIPSVANSASAPTKNSIRESIQLAKDTIASPKKISEIVNAVSKKAGRIKHTSQWKLGVNFSAGVSATSNRYLGIIGSSNSDANKAYYSADQISSPGSNSQAGNPVYHPSKIKSGASVTAGIFVQKNVSPKTIVSVGLNYKTYTTTMAVGSQQDSLIASNNYLNLSSAAYTFYRTGASYNYKNYFHFIELPIAVNVALNKQHKRAVYLTTGIAFARLIGSNALQFDTASGKYYRNNNLLNKTQVNVSVSALVGLSTMAKNPLLIGPDISFGLNKIAKANLYADRRYSYFGLRLQKNFGKK